MPTLRDFAAACRRFPGRLRAEVAAAEMQTARDAKKLAIVYSSGSSSAADLARAGHPYSIRAPQTGAYPPQFVNRRTGLFVSSWQDPVQQVINGGILRTAVLNTAPEAAFLAGTSLSVPRPIGTQVMADLSMIRSLRLRAAVDRATTSFWD